MWPFIILVALCFIYSNVWGAYSNSGVHAFEIQNGWQIAKLNVMFISEKFGLQYNHWRT